MYNDHFEKSNNSDKDNNSSSNKKTDIIVEYKKSYSKNQIRINSIR